MVCVAAFIILCFISVFVGFLSIFRRDIGAKWWKLFQKAWSCVWLKVRLQKCESNFKDDIKNSILKKVVIRRPKLVKPISIGIEVASVLIVFISIWSLVEATKAGLSLWTFGTCNLVQPSNCSLGSEACSIDTAPPSGLIGSVSNCFSEWGQIFSAIPDRLKHWSAEEYLDAPIIYQNSNQNLPKALEIFDPGCSVCLQSYRNQLKSGFFDHYQTALLPFPIKTPEGKSKFNNSELISRYLYLLSSNHPIIAPKIIHRLFTEYDENNINYQTILSRSDFTSEQAESLIKGWLIEFGLNSEQIESLKNQLFSTATTNQLEKVQDLVKNRLSAKSIPLLIYDGKKHLGLYR